MSTYIRWPVSSGGGGSGQTITLYNAVTDLPVSASDGDLAEVLATHALYVYITANDGWSQIDGPEVFNGTFTVYVDNVIGSDTTGNGSYLKPYKTFAVAFSAGSGFASEAHPVVIQLREGAFTGTNVAIPPFVSIYGTGKNATSLTLSGTLSASGGWSTPPLGLFNTAAIRDLTLSCNAVTVSVSASLSNQIYLENIVYVAHGAEIVELIGFQDGTVSNCYFNSPVRFTACLMLSHSNYYSNIITISDKSSAGSRTGISSMSFTGDFLQDTVTVQSFSGSPTYGAAGKFSGCNTDPTNNFIVDGANAAISYDASMPIPQVLNGASTTRTGMTGNLETTVAGYSSPATLTKDSFGSISYLTAGAAITLPDPTSFTNGVLEFNVPNSDTVYSQITTPVGLIGGISATTRIYPGDSIRVITCATTGYQILSSNLTANVLRVAKVNVTSAQIKGMFASPVTIVPAPGAGKFYSIMDFTLYYRYGSVQYAAGGNLQIKQGGFTAGIGTASGFLTSPVVDQITVPMTNSTATNTPAATFLNSALTLTNLTAAFTTGDGTLDVYIYYVITDTA